MKTKMKMAAVLLLIGFSTPVVAENHPSHGADAIDGYRAAMAKMMKAMSGIESSGDADIDFLQMMIPHHQSAIDMAEIELEQGDDAETLELAQKIIDAQEQEIADMKAMLERLGAEAPE